MKEKLMKIGLFALGAFVGFAVYDWLKNGESSWIGGMFKKA